MRQYNVFVKQFEEEVIGVTDLSLKGKTQLITFQKFISKFYESRNFPFAKLVLPKVVAYFSPTFEYNENSCAFIITQMKPTQGKIKDTTSIYYPWTFCITFVNLDESRILESCLLFGETQFLSEDLHEFYVPKLSDKAYSPKSRIQYKSSEILEYISGYTGPVLRFKFDHTIYNNLNFGKSVTDIRQELIDAFTQNVNEDIKWVYTEELPEISEDEVRLRFLSYYDKDNCVHMNKIDDFCLDKINNPPQFIEIIERLFQEGNK